MTKATFRVQLTRLAKGFKVTLTEGQLDAYYERLGKSDPRDWEEAVTNLLCSSSYPRSLDFIRDMVEGAKEQRLAGELAMREKHARRFMGGHLDPAGRTKEEQEFGRFRLQILLKGLRAGSTRLTVIHELEAWIEDDEHRAWADKKRVDIPGGAVSLTSSIRAEIEELALGEQQKINRGRSLIHDEKVAV